MAKTAKNIEIREANRRREREKARALALRRLAPLSRIALALAAAALLCYFLSWAHIYNTDIAGSEVSVNGWACVASFVTGHYDSPGGIYGDMAVPFYYYAAAYCERLALYTLLSLIAVVAALAVQAVATVQKRYPLHLAAAVLGAVSAALLALCFATALSMSGSDILPIYCGGNPACSIRSFAILPAALMLGLAVLDAVVFVRFGRVDKA